MANQASTWYTIKDLLDFSRSQLCDFILLSHAPVMGIKSQEFGTTQHGDNLDKLKSSFA